MIILFIGLLLLVIIILLIYIIMTFYEIVHFYKISLKYWCHFKMIVQSYFVGIIELSWLKNVYFGSVCFLVKI